MQTSEEVLAWLSRTPHPEAQTSKQRLKREHLTRASPMTGIAERHHRVSPHLRVGATAGRSRDEHSRDNGRTTRAFDARATG